MISEQKLSVLIQHVHLKHIVSTYKITIDQIKKYVVTHPMEYENDEVDAHFVTICQPHLDTKKVYDAFS